MAATKKKTTTKTAARKTLVIVESPSKAKTIGKYLGSNYKVIASVGHVRDLPKSKLGIDIENDFEPQYIAIRGKGDIIKEMRKEAKKASKIYLATDPDREGEAISWHLANLLGMDSDAVCRVVFNEITKTTIKEAIKHPRKIDLSLVDAQQARRVLDRLVGYQISPLLWRKIRKGLSAGRVQSAALKILCDREKEIQKFEPKEYWTITAEFKKGKLFTAKLSEYQKKKITIENKAENDRIIAELKRGNYTVTALTQKERTKKPYAPFTTSSMQQEASTKLNFNTRKTMMVAQQLYEGVDVKGVGSVGLITYLRTDSVRISEEARGAAASFITEHYGSEYLGRNVYTNKKKDIQDAHEAIRPSNISLVPEDIKDSLTNDQFKLYRLIWCRFMASQMTAARFDNLQVEIQNGDYTFKTTGSKLLFDGYQRIYKNSLDDDKDRILPELEKGETLTNTGVLGEQNFTQPPSRYTEASLVKELEEKNIGRPSTYAPIVATLSERKYVSREKKSLIPTELGFLVTGLMEEYFKEIVDVNFTAGMEDHLDDVEMSKTEWKKVIRDFYGPFEKELKVADEAIEKVVIEDQPTGENCELCGKPMVLKMGRFGEFAACSGYPECKNTKPIVKTIGVKCPNCGKDIVARKSKRGKLFYGCSGYPECSQSYWDKPVDKSCPKCGALLVEKKSKTGKFACSNSECDYKE
ncbi:type I DNA topoisomerase [Anaerovoracaceae bacterium 41-7]|jgi:DNA topoisomerase-1|uniref:DNA topoisomerase 1 n=1 Tax=Anaerotruncus colihominis TaxID=169435 RepID=A0A845QIL6_9FIRM|nr:MULTISPECIES: type I DNA topoisomerase [Clostridia]MCI9476833.1 type I DNA topoisomerase [Emergencia sp.]NBH60795.1 type I DNA topoisomerase [Anaerotruncus colihominis]NCE98035.1 type I DNA topoisomerase [Emergencia sp. 1XD21-10]NCF01449.1 type I DNA topoisomerase [Anaerotruncus sp. 80]